MGQIAVAEAELDDVFIDDITFPAEDGYALGASLFLPRGAKQQRAILINSATAVPRRIYRKFAGYLARRGRRPHLRLPRHRRQPAAEWLEAQ